MQLLYGQKTKKKKNLINKMSLLGKKWVISNNDPKKSALEKILENKKDIKAKEISEFYDPFLFSDMEKTIDRIKTAIKNKERVMVFGDYDVDGITGTAILFQILKKIGAEVSCRIPHRVNDGYGISDKFIDEFIEKDIKLIITVDCGISCKKQIDKANAGGIDTIITDHHNVPKEAPESFATLHPKAKDSKYPDTELTGAGVALKLAHALISRFLPEEEQEATLNSLFDLAAMGTVADLGRLEGENRLIVKHGLKVLANTKWVGIRKIMEIAGVKEDETPTTATIGFKIGPRINAAGRIGSPYTALSLILQEEQNEKVISLGKKLEDLNLRRREITETALKEAEASISGKEDAYILISESPDWHVGIVGLVAGRLVEKHSRPAIMMQDFGDTLVASARSPEFFNVIEAISSCKELLEGYGGHSGAAGFSIKKENLAKFKEKITEFAKGKMENMDLKPILKIDCEIEKDEINFDLLNAIDDLAPFGIANQKPILILSQIEPQFIDQVGKEKNHLCFSLGAEKNELRVIAFNMGHLAEQIREHKKIDLVFQLNRNLWNNKEYLQLQALDIGLNEK